MLDRMEASFWRDRWANGQTGWQEPAPNHFLTAHHAVLGLGPGRRVLVPLSGKTPDLAFLAEAGAEAIGSELVESAARAFFDERGLSAERTALGEHVRLSAGRVSIVVGDFFTLTSAQLGVIDAIYDRAAVVALPAPMRERYAARLRALAPGAAMLTVTFAHDGAPDVPPFAVERPELDRLYGAANVHFLGERDLYHPESTLAQRGATFTRELCHRVTL